MSQHSKLNFKNIVLTNTILTLVAFGLLYPINAMAIDCYGADMVDYGIYETDFHKWQKAPSTDEGKIELVDRRQLLRLTEYIPGGMGTQFGIRYVLNGDEEGKEVDILVKVVHSATVNKQEMSHVNEWLTKKKIGSTGFDGWKFNSGSELNRGNWIIQLYHEGMMLAEKSFYVY